MSRRSDEAIRRAEEQFRNGRFRPLREAIEQRERERRIARERAERQRDERQSRDER